MLFIQKKSLSYQCAILLCKERTNVLRLMDVNINSAESTRHIKDQYYVWRVVNQKDDLENMPHPFHSHDTQFRILARNGKLPYQNEMGNKDTFVVNEGEYVDVLVKFPNTGVFMYHCHNLEHQEHGMMAHFEVKDK